MLDYSLRNEFTSEGRERWKKHLDENVQDWQREVKPGDFFRADVPYGTLYGQVIDVPSCYGQPGENVRLVKYLNHGGFFDAEDDEEDPDYFHIARISEVISASELDIVAESRQRDRKGETHTVTDD